MSETAIKLENISKQYRLGVVGTGTLSRDLNRWFARVRGKEDPSLKIEQIKKISESELKKLLLIHQFQIIRH